MQTRTKAAFAAGVLALTMAAGYGVGVAEGSQPHMQSALASLQSAKVELQVAEENKGGHRANALALVNQAIGEVRAGIEYAE